MAVCLDIEDILGKFPSELSGGQKQRAAAARALLLNPEILLADEPTGALDSKNARLLMQKLSDLNREQKATILMVTHDANVASYCSRDPFYSGRSNFSSAEEKGSGGIQTGVL